MSRLAAVVLVGVVALGAEKAPPAALRALPATWTHELDEGCHWRIKPWAAPFGADPVPQNDDARWACLARRGLKSRTLLLKEIAPKWPTEAEFTAWETEDAKDNPLPAGQDARNLPPRHRR